LIVRTFNPLTGLTIAAFEFCYRQMRCDLETFRHRVDQQLPIIWWFIRISYYDGWAWMPIAAVMWGKPSTSNWASSPCKICFTMAGP
jgi:hypothetical protein